MKISNFATNKRIQLSAVHSQCLILCTNPSIFSHWRSLSSLATLTSDGHLNTSLGIPSIWKYYNFQFCYHWKKVKGDKIVIFF